MISELERQFALLAENKEKYWEFLLTILKTTILILKTQDQQIKRMEFAVLTPDHREAWGDPLPSDVEFKKVDLLEPGVIKLFFDGESLLIDETVREFKTRLNAYIQSAYPNFIIKKVKEQSGHGFCMSVILYNKNASGDWNVE